MMVSADEEMSLTPDDSVMKRNALFGDDFVTSRESTHWTADV
jgi:hypothetical protein